MAQRWPAHRILIVSGVRPRARRSSRHRVGRALDVIVEGVERHQVSEFARGLGRTGVGYYPNSTFTHVDVRRRSTYWVDLSGPGERARYVRDVNPVEPRVAPGATQATLASAMSPTDPEPAVHLHPAATDAPRDAAEGAITATVTVTVETAASPGAPTGPGAPEEMLPPLSPAQVAALRRRALRALEDAMRQAPLETAMSGGTLPR